MEKRLEYNLAPELLKSTCSLLGIRTVGLLLLQQLFRTGTTFGVFMDDMKFGFRETWPGVTKEKKGFL